MPALALAALDAVWGAVAAVLAIFGITVAKNFFSRIFGGVSVLGFHPFGSIASWFDSALSDLSGWLSSAVGAAIAWLLMPIRAVHWLVDRIIDFQTLTAQKVQNLRWQIETVQGNLQNNINATYNQLTYDINADAQNLQDNMNAGYNDLAARLVNVAQDLQGNLNQAYDALLYDINIDAQNLQDNMNAGYNDLAARLVNVAQDLQGNLNALAGQVDAALGTTITNLQHNIVASETQAIGAAQALAGQAEANAVTAMNDTGSVVGTAAWPSLLPGLQGVEQALPAVIPGYAPGLLSIPDVAPTTLAGLLLGTLAGVHALADFANACSVPMCESLRPYEPGFKGLSDLIGGGLLIAFLAAAVADPDGLTGEVVGTVGQLADDIGSGLASLVGLS